jgi:hypothetical protein
MDIVEVIPKDIHVLIELSISEINQLLIALDHVTINPDCPDKDKKYLQNEFFTKLDKLYDELKAHHES